MLYTSSPRIRVSLNNFSIDNNFIEMRQKSRTFLQHIDTQTYNTNIKTLKHRKQTYSVKTLKHTIPSHSGYLLLAV